MDAVMSDHDFEVLKQDAAAYRLKSKYAEQIETMNDDENSDTELVSSVESSDIEYDIILSDPEDERNYGYGFHGPVATDRAKELAGKPYLAGTMVDDDSFSDEDSMGSVNNSPAASPAAMRFFDFDSDSEKDYSSDTEEDSENEALLNSSKSTFSYR
jgi:hypothetical protein